MHNLATTEPDERIFFTYECRNTFICRIDSEKRNYDLMQIHGENT